MVPDEDDLVEAQITWDIGKELGLQVSNDRAMLKALSKVQQLQDFSVKRRRGRSKKQKDRSKD